MVYQDKMWNGYHQKQIILNATYLFQICPNQPWVRKMSNNDGLIIILKDRKYIRANLSMHSSGIAKNAEIQYNM